MAKKKFNQLTEATSIALADLIPFWRTSDGKTCYISFQDFLKAVKGDIATDGVIVLIDEIYYKIKPDLQMQWQIVETIGEEYPV